MKKSIYEVISACLEEGLIYSDESTLLELGIDSVQFIELIINLEEEFDIRFEDMELVYDNYKTIGQFVSIVQEAIERKRK